ncbi:metal-dependent hydrolase [Alteraurantiacibacter aestuarii]|uniref:Metal-dependent hydrolase n=1 Tax=Alteraurantiacibacter aestuarii TaxID=650004 RepID=A0A844ZK92_9SPHN|nr:metal-dependent hydrolase [Alteraurantiacibacter aestuarii]MXO87923.1 metal-dependent hydrolase [Alteraurantiacibacter aestuarii]
MNAPTKFDVDVTEGTGKAGTFPEGLAITVRNRRFGRDDAATRWWLNGDPVATAWHTALSATFPRGEALFIEAVKAHRDGVDPKLAQEIRAFVKQEINHTREHLAFNRGAEQAGYDLSRIDARVESLIGDVFARKPIVWLGITIALEHFTAMFAHEFLTHPRHFVGGDSEQVELWRWHAAEEIEHKGVAYDVWLHATRDWSRWKRWKVKSLLMVHITRSFITNRSKDCLDLLRQDGITGWRAKLRLMTYLFVRPGILRRIFPAWLAYFLPGFHPWNQDDRALIALYDSEYSAANLSAEPA